MPSRAIAALLTLILLGGCGLPEPYETYPPATPAPPPPRAANALTVTGATTTTPENEMELSAAPTEVEAPPVPAQAAAPAATPGGQVAICYNRIWNSAEAVRSAASLACGKNSAPQVVRQNIDLDACPVMTPSQAVFACGARP